MSQKGNFLGETPEERADRRRSAMIDAALSLVLEGGLPALGVRSVTSRANLSSRYFYESFAGLDELVSAATTSVAEELLQASTAAVLAPGGPDLRATTVDERLDLLRAGIDAALGVLVGDPRKAALLGAAAAGPPRVRQEVQGLVYLVAGRISGHPDAVEVGFNRATALYVAAGMLQLLVAFVSGELEMSRSELVEHLALAALGTLAATASMSSQRAT